MIKTEEIFYGKCKVCNEEHYLLEPMAEFENLSPRAVPRNLIFSEGLGTSIFVSGSGGGVRYGAVAMEIAKLIKFRYPLTFVWKSKDYYIGQAHRKILEDLKKLMGLKNAEISTKNLALMRLTEFREKLAKQFSFDPQRNFGKYKFSETLLKIAANVFSVVPSMLDILATYDASVIIKKWNEALIFAEVNFSKFIEIKGDIEYSKNAKNVYESVSHLYNMSSKIDPLGILGGS